MVSFTKALDRNLEDVKRPKPLPTGTYITRIVDRPGIDEFTASSGVQYERLSFQLAIEGPDEVDEEELEDFGNPAGYKLQRTFLIDTTDEAGFEKTLYYIKQFLGNAGVETEGVTLGEAIEQAQGASMIVEVGHRPDPKNPENVYPEVKRTFPLD
ncbi:hypothetical protein D6827_01675 [Candidatus Parcubacteria bacterium]|nr:MAG: hypothetical protein D6827_01675 [Candidatus Parcubacteria bacterium]